MDKKDSLQTGGYTEEEKKEIMATIDKVVSSNRIGGNAGRMIPFPARKKGILFPIIINLVAAAMVSGGWFLAQWYFQTREETLKLQTSQIFSTEGRVLAKLMEESKAQLEAKNKELAKIQGDLSQIENEKNKLVQDFDSRLDAKESELRKALSQQLEEERQRLKGQGVSEREIAAQLAAFEARKNDEFQRSLDDFRKKAQTEIDARNQELASLKGRLQTIAVDQEKLKSDLEARAREKEASLQSQLSQQSASLDKLAKERDEETLFNRQTDLVLQKFQETMAAFQYPEALESLENLGKLAATGLESPYESVRKRAQAQKDLAGSLTAAVTELRTQSQKTGADPRFEAFKAAAQKASEIKDAGERYGALVKAADGVPEIQSVFTSLRQFETQRAAAEITQKVRLAAQNAAKAGPRESLISYLKIIPQEDLRTAVLSSSTALNELQDTAVKELQDKTEELLTQNTDLQATIKEQEENLVLLRETEKAFVTLKAQWDALTASYLEGRELIPGLVKTPTAETLEKAQAAFAQAFESETGKALFPAFSQTFTALKAAILEVAGPKADEIKPIRDKAFQEVLTFAKYLAGTSAQALSARESSEKLAKADPSFKEVADALQLLAKTGSKETLIKTNKFGLLGPLISLTSAKAVAEALTSVKTDAGLPVEVRRPGAQGETILARGVVSASSGKRVELELSEFPEADKRPISGDVVYIEIK